MSSVAVTIQELCESGQSPSKICYLLNSRASRSGVYKVLKRLKETDSALLKVRSTPSRKVRTPKLIKNTRGKIRKRSVPKLASSSGVSYGTLQTVLKNDLNLSPYKIAKAQLLSQATKTKRRQRAKLFLENLRDGMQPSVLRTDEKLFTLQAIHNL